MVSRKPLSFLLSITLNSSNPTVTAGASGSPGSIGSMASLTGAPTGSAPGGVPPAGGPTSDSLNPNPVGEDSAPPASDGASGFPMPKVSALNSS